MTDDLETRLRAALRARSEEITPDQLTRTLDLPHTDAAPAHRSRRGSSWLVAAAAAVVVAAGATGIVLATRPSAPTPEPVASVTVTSTPTPSPTGAREQPRSAIPWGQVGAGWSAAAWATSRDATTATLYLVSPAGTRYAVGAMPNVAVYDITRDGRRILTGSSDPNAVLQWDVAAGASQSIPLGEPGGAAYTKPDGQALLTVDNSGPAPRLQRRALDGSVTMTYPDGTGLARQSPDGQFVVTGTTTGLSVYGNATGTLVRTLPPPAGYSECAAVSWWPDGRALTRCALGGNGVSNLWLYRLDGGSATTLTTAVAGSARPFGYQAAWPVSTGTLVQEAVGCGVGPLAMLTSPSTSTRITFPFKGVPDPNTVVGDVAYLVVSSAECGGAQARALVTYDVATGQSRVLLGPGANDGTVGPVAVIDPSR